MKLSYSNSYNYMNIFSLGILIFFLIILVIIHIPFLELGMSINIMFIVVEIITIVGIIYQIYSIKEENKIRKQEIWKNGEKYQGYISDIGYIRRYKIFGRHYTIEKVSYSNQNISHNVIDYYITVFYNNLYYKDIKSIKYDKSYILLGMLLNPYPVKEKIKIPIDIYIYKNKIYADLNSINLSELKGYEKCKELMKI